MKTYGQLAGLCLLCGFYFNRASAAGIGRKDGAPKAGDVSICLNCGTLHEFDANLRMHPARPEILQEFSPADRLRLETTMRAIRERGPIARERKQGDA